MDKNTTCIVIGASGFIGGHLTRELIKSYERVIALTRNHKLKTLPKEIQWIIGDVKEHNIWQRVLKKDAVLIFLANINDEKIYQIKESIKEMIKQSKLIGLKRIIYCSTADVAGSAKDIIITEQTKSLPKTKYEIIKYEIENVLIAENNNDIELVILRPTAVFGSGGKNLRLMINRILHRCNFINYIARTVNGRRKLNLLYVENFISAIMSFIETDKIYKSEIFIISEDEEEINNYIDVENILSQKLLHKKQKRPTIYFPSCILKFILILKGKSNTNPNRVYSNQKLLKTGYMKKYPLEKAIRKYASEYMK